MKKDIISEAAILRKKAEGLLIKKPSIDDFQPSEAEALKLIHELEVYQVELEMQNEELMRTREQAEVVSQKYVDLYDFAPSGYFTLSKEGKIIELNLSGAKMLGKERSHLKNRQFGFFISDNTKPTFNLFLEKVFNNKAQETCEVALSTKGNLPMYVHLTVIVTEKEERCFITAVDVTGRKEALVKFEKAIYTSGEAIFLTDREGVFTFVNPAFTSLYGFSSDEIIGKTTPSIIRSGELDKSVYKVFWQTLLNGNEVRGELINKRKDGTLITIDGSATPIIDEEKNIIGFLGIQHDITERKRLEERLRVQTDAMEAAIDGLAILDAEQNYIYMNKSHAGIYGYDNAGELVGKSWRLLYDTVELQRFDREIMPEFSQKGYYQGRAAGKKKDGSTFPQEISLTALENGGSICSVLDITERKQAEEKIKLFSSAVESAYDGIILSDMNGSIIFANASAINIFGYTPEELMKLNVVSLTADPNITKEIISKVLLSGKWSGETMSLKKNNEEFFTLLSVSVIKDEKGIPISMMGVFWDTSDRKRADEALKQAYDELENLHNNLDEAIFSVDIIHNKMLQVSIAHKAVFGYSPEEFFKNPQLWYEMIVPEDKPIVDAGYPVLFSGKKLYQEFRIVHTDGQIRWIEAKITPTLDTNGKLIRIDGIATDITERKQTEEVMRMSEERQRTILQTAMDGFWLVDMQGRLLEVNETYCRMSGYNVHELLAMSVPDLDAFEAADDTVAHIQKIMAKGEDRFESRHRRKDGSIFDVEISVQYQPGEAGRLVVFMRDITERKQSEVALEQAYNDLDNLHNNLNEAIFSMDMIHNKMLQISIAHKAVFGYPPEEFFKNPQLWYEMIVPEDKPIVDAGYPVLFSGKKLYQEFRIVHTDGQIRWIEAKIIPTLDTNGKLIRIDGIASDVTDRKRAEEALRKSEQILEVIINTIPVRVFWKDKNLNYLGCNAAFASDAGFMKSEDVIGKDDYAMSRSKYAELYRTDDKIVMGSGKSKLLFEEPLSSSTGELSYILTSKVPLKDAKGEIIGILGAYLDITERKLAEEKVKIINERFELATNAAAISVWEHDLITDIIKIDDNFNRIYGNIQGNYQIEFNEFIKFIHPDDVDIIKINVEEAIKSDKNTRFEFRIIRPDGDIRNIEAHIKIVKDKTNKPLKVFGINLDISEFKRAEKELITAKVKAEESEFLLKESQKVGHIGSYKTDFIAGYWESSETLDEIFGIDKNYDRSIKGWLDIVHPDERNTLNDYLINEVIGKKTAFEREYRIVRINDKQTRWVHGFGATTFDISENITEMIGTIQDITERKVFELELKTAKERAEESDRLKSAFLANMSHEIRTPMNGILGFANLLKEPKLSGEEQQEYISIIEQSGERMLNIINDIINISKVEAGQMEVSILQTNANELIDFIYTFFKPEAEQKGLRISYITPLPAKEAFIQTDREKVYAVLTNLVKNAIKFTQKGSVEVGYEKKGNCLEFYVKDTGRGIPAEKTRIVFERFRQVDDSLHRNFEGAGLGLSISKAYVEMLGGKIWVESQYKEGSAFYFTLPYNGKTEEKILNKHVAHDAGSENTIKKLKILIAEDDELSTVLLMKTMKNYTREILKVRNGTEAVETCRNHPDIDLILMDIQMPKVDGYQATKQIRQFNTEVIIIVQTAFALSGDREKALEAGCNDYLAKPINQGTLNELIKKYFSK